MRRWAALLFLPVFLVLSAGPATASCGPSLSIAKRTSAIYAYDGSPDGTGPTLPATTVRSTVKRCPDGQYQLSASLVQDGISMNWATTGLGAGEVICNEQNRRFALPLGFAGPSLHPGKATATFALYRYVCADGICSLEDQPTVKDSRTVRIPR